MIKFNHILLDLISNLEDSKSIDTFKPISLCNLIYKIISKVATNRLKVIVPNIILDEQKDFIQGRQLMDGAILIHELIHSLNTMGDKGFLIKLDMKKLFNRINWSFLMRIMGKFGFETR